MIGHAEGIITKGILGTNAFVIISKGIIRKIIDIGPAVYSIFINVFMRHE